MKIEITYTKMYLHVGRFFIPIPRWLLSRVTGRTIVLVEPAEHARYIKKSSYETT